MMSLFDLAKSANTELFEDAYGSGEQFYGQVQLYNESVRSGPASRRRIIEVGPDVVIPAKLTVKEVSTGIVYVLADGAPDWFRGRVITVKHPAVPIDLQFDIKTPAQLLAGTGGVLGVWAAPSYIRRVILEESSDYLGGYEMLYSPYFSPVAPGAIFIGGGKYFRARESSREDDIGLGVSEAVELVDPLRSFTYTSTKGKYDPVTDTDVGTTPVTVQTFVEPLYLNYEHEVLGYVKPEAGDLAISVLKSVAPNLAAGDTFGTNRVLSVADSGSTWTSHCRRHM